MGNQYLDPPVTQAMVKSMKQEATQYPGAQWPARTIMDLAEAALLWKAELDEIKAEYHGQIRKANTAEWRRDEAIDEASHANDRVARLEERVGKLEDKTYDAPTVKEIVNDASLQRKGETAELERLRHIERNLWRDLADETRRGDAAREELEHLRVKAENLERINQQNVSKAYEVIDEESRQKKEQMAVFDKLTREYEARLEMFRKRNRELEKALRDIKGFAQANHEGQPHHIVVHSLTVDIPQMVDDTLQDPEARP